VVSFKRAPTTVIKITPNKQKSVTQRQFTINGQIFFGYSLDQFLLKTEISADLNSSNQWKLIPAKFAETAKPVTAANPKIIALILAGHPRTKTSEKVGSHAFAKIKECIKFAAENEKLKCLKKNKIGERYECTISRAKLAEALSKKYGKKLKCRESTIHSALSDFVACPGYRIK
jgi:hypothetical protein